MRLFAIGDLHLDCKDQKPMDVFGPHWTDHTDKIKEDWLNRVRDNDVVLIPGDISWAMQLEDAVYDLDFIMDMPGTKLIIRGNHDYWWSSIGRVRRSLKNNTYAIQNDCVIINDLAFCGSRGWVIPQTDAPSDDRKIYTRELMRLEMSLKHAITKGANKIIAMLHYPPLTEELNETGFTALFEQYNVSDVYYGHLHGASVKQAVTGLVRGVNYHLVSCDALGFRLFDGGEL